MLCLSTCSHVHIQQWLKETCGMDKPVLYQEIGIIPGSTCSHVHMQQWLKETCGMDKPVLYQEIGITSGSTCSHVHMQQWLKETCGMDKPVLYQEIGITSGSKCGLPSCTSMVSLPEASLHNRELLMQPSTEVLNVLVESSVQ